MYTYHLFVLCSTLPLKHSPNVVFEMTFVQYLWQGLFTLFDMHFRAFAGCTVLLCKFHVKQSWNRHLGQNEDKAEIVSLYVHVHSTTVLHHISNFDVTYSTLK
jgi:hypothetical protein